MDGRNDDEQDRTAEAIGGPGQDRERATAEDITGTTIFGVDPSVIMQGGGPGGDATTFPDIRLPQSRPEETNLPVPGQHGPPCGSEIPISMCGALEMPTRPQPISAIGWPRET